MWGGIGVKDCPGEGCQNRIFVSQEMCSGYKQKQKAAKERDSEWGVHLWALQGIKDFRPFLKNHAKFEDEYGPE